MAIEQLRLRLETLNANLDNLEKMVEAKEKAKKPAKKAGQDDLFGSWGIPAAKPANANALNNSNAAILAKKLDNAIERMQGLLKEAESA